MTGYERSQRAVKSKVVAWGKSSLLNKSLNSENDAATSPCKPYANNPAVLAKRRNADGLLSNHRPTNPPPLPTTSSSSFARVEEEGGFERAGLPPPLPCASESGEGEQRRTRQAKCP
eukprot:CAMPEP_0171901094 /NCGR_PEP_ID=MMETSP0992-20121227/50118_1 /TAXON_ID=483369 /ORGANISM="non described non described, Strain CCMP2098" /LENGTH=116 /DNA_ID=CAMNT_0012529531 /DNA_START=233 /DNA_END=583 /DNA_ORIENTATION=-